MRMRKKEKKQLNFTMTYRTRRRLHRFGVFFGYLFGAAALVWVCWFMWLNRFVVYSGSEAKLDFNWVSHADQAVVATAPEEQTVAVRYNEGRDKINTSTEMTKISGFYVTTDDLIDSVDGVNAAVRQLPEGSAVMLDLKSPYGTFFYSTKLDDSVKSDKVDLAAVDKLIQTVTKGSYYAIARVPAFRDQHYGLENAPYGTVLPHSSGGYMWADDDGCYWMNPASSGAIAYVMSIAKELYDLGFDEVVFTDFRFPATDNILFEGDRASTIAKAAEALVAGCATNNFTVSFASSDTGFALPAGRSRLYLTDVDAAKAQSAADATSVADKQLNLVFLTDTNDTRFDTFSVIRPMPAAEIPQ